MDYCDLEFVDLASLDLDSINQNPVKSGVLEPFWIEEGEVELEKGKPNCEFCCTTFDSFSSLCQHQAKPCHLEFETQPISNPVHVRVHERIERYFPVDVVTVDRKMALVTKRRLQSSLISKFNLEAYYELIKEYTSKTVWIELGVEDIKLLKRLCAVQLATAMGMASRESQEEAVAREKLEDKMNEIIEKGKTVTWWFQFLSFFFIL